MNRHLIALILTCIAAITLGTSCTRNNGDIGPWFGIWQIDEIYIDSQPDPEYRKNLFWAFQSTVIEMMMKYDEVAYLRSWGTWEFRDNELILNFSYSDDENPEGSFSYVPLKPTHLPPGISVLHIDSYNGSNKMTLSYISPSDNRTYVYIIKKI